MRILKLYLLGPVVRLYPDPPYMSKHWLWGSRTNALPDLAPGRYALFSVAYRLVDAGMTPSWPIELLPDSNTHVLAVILYLHRPPTKVFGLTVGNQRSFN